MQSRKHSLVETCVNVGIGWVTAFILQLLIFPAFGIEVPLSTNIYISLIFTSFAIVRGYIIRRFFNAKLVKFYEKFDDKPMLGEIAYRQEDNVLVFGTQDENGNNVWVPVQSNEITANFTSEPISVKII